MKIILMHRQDSLGSAWEQEFRGVDQVEIRQGDICQVRCDAIVSPANSFGFMDGGLDRALVERFGETIESQLQEWIARRPLRELLVGEAVILPTGDALVPWLVSAPTMRVPMHIRTTVNAYLAMKAILIGVLQHSRSPAIQEVAVPGLGTGVGGLRPDIAARQMRAAFDEVILSRTVPPGDFGEAQKRQLALNPESRIYD